MDVSLWMILLGCKPKGRHTEQHDIFFGIAEKVTDLLPEIKAFWPEAEGNLHLDAIRKVSVIQKDDKHYTINVCEKNNFSKVKQERLFFLNLGGYKKNEFDEFHYKMIVVAESKSEAIQQAKQTAFFKHTGFDKANSHIDDKYGIDVDDLIDIEEILSLKTKEKYCFEITEITSEKSVQEDEIQLGYFTIKKLEKGIIEAS